MNIPRLTNVCYHITLDNIESYQERQSMLLTDISQKPWWEFQILKNEIDSLEWVHQFENGYAKSQIRHLSQIGTEIFIPFTVGLHRITWTDLYESNFREELSFNLFLINFLHCTQIRYAKLISLNSLCRLYLFRVVIIFEMYTLYYLYGRVRIFWEYV